MEDLNSRNPGGRAKAGDGQACFITAGIPCRTGHHTGRSAWSPTQLGVGEAAINAGFQCFNKVALEAHQDGLGFRIAEAGIELQHLGAARRHHQPAIEHAGEGSVFACHAVNGRLRNVAQNPLLHTGFEHFICGIGTHAASVRPCVALADAFVVLGGSKRRHMLAVGEAEEADLVAGEELLDDYLLLSFAQERAREKAVGASMAVRRDWQMTTPLPAASPSALTTMGGWKKSTAFSISAA